MLFCLGLFGCVTSVSDNFCLDDDVDAIVIDLNNGDVNVTAGRANELCIDVELGGLGSGAEGSYVEEGVLLLDYKCSGLCGGDVSLVAPLRIDIDVRLGAGDIRIDGRNGDVYAKVGAGEISATDLTSEYAELIVAAGEVQAEWIEQPLQVDVVVAAGSIDLIVPKGTYSLDLSAGSGSIDVSGITESATAESAIMAITDAGSIVVQGQ
jgi:DUF4097 and DUF4098 domain-containing protein YvlB